jgi:hypothetical protein
LEAKSSSGGVAIVQGKALIMYDDRRWVEGGRGEVHELVAWVRK